MASSRHDDLARRLAERMQQGPSKGGAMASPVRTESTTQQDVRERPALQQSPTSASPTSGRKPSQPKAAPLRTKQIRTGSSSGRPEARPDPPSERAHRGASGTTLRGHLVPDEIHRDARRRKIELRIRRATRITWNDVMIEAISLIDGQRQLVLSELRNLDANHRAAPTRRRLVQATLPVDVDQRLVEIQLELSEQPGSAATYENLWAAAIALWLRSTT